MLKHMLLIVALVILPLSAMAKGEYMTADAFLNKAFPNGQPQVKTLWLSKELKQQVETILNHPFAGLRLRYWVDGQRSAWIFNEIGKEQPITIGVVIDQQQIDHIAILAFRESRGGEVRYPFFTQQFQGVSLNQQQGLSKIIDGISGATLSVRAVTKVSRVSLYLHQQVLADTQPAVAP